MGYGLRKIASMVRSDRKTFTRMVEVAKGLGLAAGDSVEGLSDEFVGGVVSVMRPPKPDRHGESWALLVEHRSKIEAWVEAGDVPAVKMVELLARQGVPVPERTLNRFLAAEFGSVIESTVGTNRDRHPISRPEPRAMNLPQLAGHGRVSATEPLGPEPVPDTDPWQYRPLRDQLVDPVPPVPVHHQRLVRHDPPNRRTLSSEMFGDRGRTGSTGGSMLGRTTRWRGHPNERWILRCRAGRPPTPTRFQ